MQDRIKEMLKYFGVYGYGHFNLSVSEIEELFLAVNSKNYEQQLQQLYEKLENKRMG